MQVKFQNTSETLRTTKTQLETSEGTKQLLTTKMQQLTEKLDSSNSKLSELLQERESLQRGLDDVRTQKQQSEMGRADINSAVSCTLFVLAERRQRKCESHGQSALLLLLTTDFRNTGLQSWFIKGKVLIVKF